MGIASREQKVIDEVQRNLFGEWRDASEGATLSVACLARGGRAGGRC